MGTFYFVDSIQNISQVVVVVLLIIVWLLGAYFYICIIADDSALGKKRIALDELAKAYGASIQLAIKPRFDKLNKALLSSWLLRDLFLFIVLVIIIILIKLFSVQLLVFYITVVVILRIFNRYILFMRFDRKFFSSIIGYCTKFYVDQSFMLVHEREKETLMNDTIEMLFKQIYDANDLVGLFLIFADIAAGTILSSRIALALTTLYYTAAAWSLDFCLKKTIAYWSPYLLKFIHCLLTKLQSLRIVISFLSFVSKVSNFFCVLSRRLSSFGNMTVSDTVKRIKAALHPKSTKQKKQQAASWLRSLIEQESLYDIYIKNNIRVLDLTNSNKKLKSLDTAAVLKQASCTNLKQPDVAACTQLKKAKARQSIQQQKCSETQCSKPKKVAITRPVTAEEQADRVEARRSERRRWLLEDQARSRAKSEWERGQYPLPLTEEQIRAIRGVDGEDGSKPDKKTHRTVMESIIAQDKEYEGNRSRPIDAIHGSTIPEYYDEAMAMHTSPEPSAEVLAQLMEESGAAAEIRRDALYNFSTRQVERAAANGLKLLPHTEEMWRALLGIDGESSSAPDSKTHRTVSESIALQEAEHLAAQYWFRNTEHESVHNGEQAHNTIQSAHDTVQQTQDIAQSAVKVSAEATNDAGVTNSRVEPLVMLHDDLTKSKVCAASSNNTAAAQATAVHTETHGIGHAQAAEIQADAAQQPLAPDAEQVTGRIFGSRFVRSRARTLRAEPAPVSEQRPLTEYAAGGEVVSGVAASYSIAAATAQTTLSNDLTQGASHVSGCRKPSTDEHAFTSRDARAAAAGVVKNIRLHKPWFLKVYGITKYKLAAQTAESCARLTQQTAGTQFNNQIGNNKAIKVVVGLDKRKAEIKQYLAARSFKDLQALLNGQFGELVKDDALKHVFNSVISFVHNDADGRALLTDWFLTIYEEVVFNIKIPKYKADTVGRHKAAAYLATILGMKYGAFEDTLRMVESVVYPKKAKRTLWQSLKKFEAKTRLLHGIPAAQHTVSALFNYMPAAAESDVKRFQTHTYVIDKETYNNRLKTLSTFQNYPAFTWMPADLRKKALFNLNRYLGVHSHLPATYKELFYLDYWRHDLKLIEDAFNKSDGMSGIFKLWAIRLRLDGRLQTTTTSRDESLACKLVYDMMHPAHAELEDADLLRAVKHSQKMFDIHATFSYMSVEAPAAISHSTLLQDYAAELQGCNIVCLNKKTHTYAKNKITLTPSEFILESSRSRAAGYKTFVSVRVGCCFIQWSISTEDVKQLYQASRLFRVGLLKQFNITDADIKPNEPNIYDDDPQPTIDGRARCSGLTKTMIRLGIRYCRCCHAYVMEDHICKTPVFVDPQREFNDQLISGSWAKVQRTINELTDEKK